MDLYHVAVIVGGSLFLYAVYCVLAWFINRPYKMLKIDPPEINQVNGRANLDMKYPI